MKGINFKNKATVLKILPWAYQGWVMLHPRPLQQIPEDCTWASTRGLTSHGSPSWAEVFNRARAEKPGVYNWITDAGVQLSWSQVFQEYCCGALSPHTAGDTCDSWNRSCIPKTRAEPHRCRVGKLLPSYLRSVCWVGPGRQSSLAERRNSVSGIR